MKFREHVYDNNVISLHAPDGFNLVTRSILGQDLCTNFNYPNVLLPLLNTPDPSCSCELPGPRCKLEFTLKEGAPNLVAILMGDELEFDIGGANPTGNPETVANIWRAYHRRGGKLRASSDVPGWLVYAQPQNITVEITGLYKRAYSWSELSITFVPTAWAS